MKYFIYTLCCTSLILFSCTSLKQTTSQENGNQWYLKCTSDYDSCSYVDENGQVMIPSSKYLMFYTDTFLNFAIVLDSSRGWIGIDKDENVLFSVLPFDNGPDRPVEGLFRIIDSKGKIGFANTKGEIVIPPKYACAFPFSNGKSKVSKDCKEEMSGEHKVWLSQNWFHIDKEGNVVK